MRKHNIILNTDSYKVSMYRQYPPGTTKVYSYLEGRGPSYSAFTFFGLQAFIKEYLLTPITQQDIDQAVAFYGLHGEPFNQPGWQIILEEYDGYLPLEIRAIPEGTYVPIRYPVVTVVNTDPRLAWLTTWIETALVRAIWYPSTVATKDHTLRQFINLQLERTGDPSAAPFKLHDFGARGASSYETASIGGAAHLLYFAGTDTVSGVTFLMDYYHAGVEGFSIPAAEHSTIIAWGKDHEADAYQNMLREFATPGSVVAVVSDSYDIFHAVEHIWGTALKEQIEQSGATLVIRPDSGNPIEVNERLVDLLAKQFGYTINEKGYKVLNHVRLIQGDGVDESVIQQVLTMIVEKGYSADNIAFGMGAALLQKVHRDELGFAMKASSIERNGQWISVEKTPQQDLFKASKAGRITTILEENQFKIGEAEDEKDLLRVVYLNGKLLIDESFNTIRGRAQKAL